MIVANLVLVEPILRTWRTLALIASIGCVSSSAMAALREADQARARELLEELIAIDTTHAKGTTAAVQALAMRFKTAGFDTKDIEIVEPKPGKANLVVRYRGKGRGKPVLFIAHLDVVEANPEDWTVPPFQLTEKQGYFYGRGASDIKSEVADLASNLIRLRREKYLPNRDLIVAFTADEEAGATLNGVEWLLKNRRELIDAEFVINPDSGGGDLVDGRRSVLRLQTAEKYYATYQLEITNPGGHSSMPTPDNAIYRLSEALTRWSKFDFPVQLNDTTRAYFERLAAKESGQTAADLRSIAAGAQDAAAVARVSRSPLFNSTLRTTCVATMLQAGHAESALPQRARATIQCRIFPSETVEFVKQTLERVLADPGVKVTVLGEPAPSPASALDPRVLRAVEKVSSQLWPEVPVLPVMDPWASDSYFFRFAGVPVYGVSGIFSDQETNGAHGQDERVAVDAFYAGVDFMYRLIKEVSR